MAGMKSPARVLTAALGLGWAFDALFWGRVPGLSALLFVLMCVAALAALAGLEGIAPRWRNMWLLAPLLFFAAMVAVRANFLLNALNILACTGLLMLLAYFYAAGNLHRLGAAGYYFTLMIAGVNAAFRAAPLVPAGVNVRGLRTRGAASMRAVLPILRGLLIALPVATIFTVLLASADPVFAQWAATLFNLPLPDLREALWHAALVMAVAWLLAGGLAFALSRRGAGEDEPWDRPLDSIPRIIHLGFTESAVVLLVVNAIFLAFGWIQVRYLFGGGANIGLEGYTYAEYARRGFFELAAAAVLTLGLIMGLHTFTWREARSQRLLFNVLATAMVSLTGLLLASAFYRMLLYEEAYGFTHLRLYVHTFEVWLAVLFGWVVVALWAMPRRFALGAFACALGFLATLNMLDGDKAIAEWNLARYGTTGKIDIAYVSQLSEDAVPSLLAGADRLDPPNRDYLLKTLRWKLQGMEQDPTWRDLPSFNLARWSAYNALAAHRTRLMSVPDSTPLLAGEGTSELEMEQLWPYELR